MTEILPYVVIKTLRFDDEACMQVTVEYMQKTSPNDVICQIFKVKNHCAIKDPLYICCISHTLTRTFSKKRNWLRWKETQRTSALALWSILKQFWAYHIMYHESFIR